MREFWHLFFLEMRAKTHQLQLNSQRGQNSYNFPLKNVLLPTKTPKKIQTLSAQPDNCIVLECRKQLAYEACFCLQK